MLYALHVKNVWSGYSLYMHMKGDTGSKVKKETKEGREESFSAMCFTLSFYLQ
jgi:hypothetical protein